MHEFEQTIYFGFIVLSFIIGVFCGYVPLRLTLRKRVMEPQEFQYPYPSTLAKSENKENELYILNMMRRFVEALDARHTSLQASLDNIASAIVHRDTEEIYELRKQLNIKVNEKPDKQKAKKGKR